jgi:RimJ/RimL family protein N-acetyltransferase
METALREEKERGVFKLQGDKGFLVAFEERHLRSPEYLDWLRDFEVVKTINRLEYTRPVSFEEVRRYCEQVLQSERDMFLALHTHRDERFVGTVRVSRLDWVTRSADLGILIGDREQWGCGLATEALGLVGRHLFEKLGMRKLTAGVMAVNPGMLRVFEKLGFQREGLFRRQDFYQGDYVDHVYLGCFREEFTWPAAEEDT